MVQDVVVTVIKLLMPEVRRLDLNQERRGKFGHNRIFGYKLI